MKLNKSKYFSVTLELIDYGFSFHSLFTLIELFYFFGSTRVSISGQTFLFAVVLMNYPIHFN